MNYLLFLLQKQEPIDPDRNDSGINSGSDFHSSSPGSDNSQDFNQIYHQQSNLTTQTPSTYYSTPVIPRTTSNAFPSNSNNFINPLTPPEPLLVSPRMQTTPTPSSNDVYDVKLETTLTPHYSPNLMRERSKSPEEETADDHLRRLQMSLEKTFLPATSPKPSEQSNDDDNGDMDLEDYDEQGMRMPKMNSHGKVKKFKCKQCDFVAITKLDFWEHTKNHIKVEKMLTCPKCPFVTEYKHHLEYHLRNHFGSKPFKCDKCSYTCVNKSMLNSHMKSHSNVYQYRCNDCSYATKYCHSLKLHLRKYGHKPAMVLNPDGTPNPLPIIDVYGTRRGPKQKNHRRHQQQQQPKEQEETQQQITPNPLAQLMITPPQFPLAFPYPFLGGFSALNNPLFFQNMSNNQREESECDDDRSLTSSLNDDDDKSVNNKESVLDLSKPDNDNADQPQKNRRKGKAIKLDRMELDGSEEDDDVDEEDDDKEVNEDKEEETINNNKNVDFNCQYCDIAFGDIVLYTMHMGYHGYKDPFTCNMCGEQCNDKVSFFLHIARTSHS